ncbi:RNA 3'-terminal phosphate cyclase [Candidatus Bathyarchaeota archaeon]|nr:RNA 3'-terminal phosphate cyclase [Candidatus Bathyarchaeota archaeon]
MLEVNGQEKSGSGTILRLSIAFSSIIGEELHIYNIRKRRPKPGLRPQHLEAVLTAAKICNAKVEGAVLNSTEVWYSPGKIRSGRISASIGTAGSIPMLLMTTLPICAHSKGRIILDISQGGTDVKHAPTINYIDRVLLPTLKKMGIEASLEIKRYGYYPKGNGEVSITIDPPRKLGPLKLERFGKITQVEGISVATYLEDRKVAERQAKSAKECLARNGIECKITVVNDRSNKIQKGSSILIRTSTDTGVIMGADSIGEIRKRSEQVGLEAARLMLREVERKATADVHLSDMIIPYVTSCDETSTFLCREITEHLDTNIWLAQKMLDARFKVERRGPLFQVKFLPNE